MDQTIKHNYYVLLKNKNKKKEKRKGEKKNPKQNDWVTGYEMK